MIGILKLWQKRALWERVLIGLVIGSLIGLSLRYSLGSDTASNIVNTWIKPFGDAFVRAIKMLVAPLIFITIVSGIIGMGSPKQLGRLGGKTIILYLITTLFAVILGLIMGTLIKPGKGVNYQSADLETSQMISEKIANSEAKAKSLTDRLLQVIPNNPFESLAQGDVLAIIFFAILLGVAIIFIGEKKRPLAILFESASEAIQKMTLMIMETAPYGVAALMSWVLATKGLSILNNLFLLAIAFYVAALIHVVFIYGGMIKLVLRLPFIRFAKGIIDAQSVAFSTSSSNATLPVTITCVNKNLGVKKAVASSVLPIGTTINMDGTSIYIGIVVLFGTQAAGISLGMTDYFMIILLATLASIGTAGVPSVSLFLSAVILGQMGLTTEEVVLVIAFIFPFDRLLDMGRTVVNITGDALIACIVAKSEGQLDEDVYKEKARV